MSKHSHEQLQKRALVLFGEHGYHLNKKAHLNIGGGKFLAYEPCTLTELAFYIIKVKLDLGRDKSAYSVAVPDSKLVKDELKK